MSVPTWERDLSKIQFLFELYKLNIRVGQIVMGKPKKYRENYGDKLINECLDALKYAQVANSIYMSVNTSESDYETRRKYLQMALGLVDNISTTADIFLSLNWNVDGANHDQIERQQKYFGETTKTIHDLLKGVMASDKRTFKGQK